MLDDLSHFSPDRDGESSPESIKKYREALRIADGVLICTPEYAHNVPGVLKYSNIKMYYLKWRIERMLLFDRRRYRLPMRIRYWKSP